MREDVKKIKIEEYNYNLPPERIAKYPLNERDQSKLLISKRSSLETSTYSNLDNHLPKNSFLVFNETKVIQARLLFPKNENTTIEIFCLEPLDTDIQIAMQAKGEVYYKCLVGGARKWKNNPLQITTKSGYILKAIKLENLHGTFSIHFIWDNDISFAQILEDGGKTPLPPYLNRKAELEDRDRYQTVFAKVSGSVAAPTASLHFNTNLLDKIRNKGIHSTQLTLHVGAGTFKPVDSEKIEEHEMHAEEFMVSKGLVQDLLNNEKKSILAVGTTSMRALESIFWLGYMVQNNEINDDEIPLVPQWIPYETKNPKPSLKIALSSLLNYLNKKDIESFLAKTAIIIAPSYTFNVCNGLITNFHQPKSTLLLLVSAIVGDKWKEIYDYALKHDFRFLSYGDGSLILDLIE